MTSYSRSLVTMARSRLIFEILTKQYFFGLHDVMATSGNHSDHAERWVRLPAWDFQSAHSSKTHSFELWAWNRQTHGQTHGEQRRIMPHFDGGATFPAVYPAVVCHLHVLHCQSTHKCFQNLHCSK